MQLSSSPLGAPVVQPSHLKQVKHQATEMSFGVSIHQKQGLQIGNRGDITIDSEGRLKVGSEQVGRVDPDHKEQVLRDTRFFHTTKNGFWAALRGDRTEAGKSVDHFLHPGTKVFKGNGAQPILDLFGSPFRKDAPIVHVEDTVVSESDKQSFGSKLMAILPVGGKSSKTTAYKSALQGFEVKTADGKTHKASLIEISLRQLKNAGVQHAQINVTHETAPIFQRVVKDSPLLEGMDIQFDISEDAGRGDLSHPGKRGFGRVLDLFQGQGAGKLIYADAYYPEQERTTIAAMREILSNKADGILKAQQIAPEDIKQATNYGIFHGEMTPDKGLRVLGVAEQKPESVLREMVDKGQLPKDGFPANVGDNTLGSKAIKKLLDIYRGPGSKPEPEHGFTKREKEFNQLAGQTNLYSRRQDVAFVDTGSSAEEMYSKMSFNGPNGTKLSGDAEPGTKYQVHGNAITMPQEESQLHQDFRMKTRS